MRIRFEIQSLAALGTGAHRLPINCWRLTINYLQGTHTGVLLDGQNLFTDLVDGAGGLHLAQFVVGGVVDRAGNPVNMDQVLLVTVPLGVLAQGVLIYEYLEP